MKLNILDIFAGCGGMSFGMKKNGHNIIGAIEKDLWAAQTYSYNIPEAEMVCEDIKKIDSSSLKKLFGSTVDTVIGGPPCQGFSVSGKRQYGLHNQDNQLIYEFIRVVDVLQPQYFILENVHGFTSGTVEGRTKALNFILKQLTSRNYYIRHKILQASEYSIPQYRSRLFIIGSKNNFNVNPFPQPTSKKQPISILEAIQDLPFIKSGEGTDGPQEYSKLEPSEYAKKLRSASGVVYNHQAMNHTNRLIERFASIPPGGKGYDIGRKIRNNNTVTVYKSNNQRLIGELPSLCITANWQSSYIHPFLDRNLTVREAARIQSFPDDFIFKGKRALMSSTLLKREGRLSELHLSQCHQVGNAVPPLLAEEIGVSLREIDKNGEDTISSTLEAWLWRGK